MAIAEKGHALRRGEIAFAYRIDARPEARSKRRGQDVAASSVAGTPARDPSLLPALKTLRLRLAKERRVPAYVIFSDRTLIDMAARQPRDLNAFAEVHGVGALYKGGLCQQPRPPSWVVGAGFPPPTHV